MDIEQRNQLIKEIETAFENTPYPGDNNISSYLEALKGHTWKTVPIDVIGRYKDSFHRLGTQAFRHFIPALMISIICEPEKADTLVNNIIGLLTPHVDILLVTRTFNRRTNSLDTGEAKAIAKFVLSFKELMPNSAWSFMESEALILEIAIDYWSQYLTED